MVDLLLLLPADANRRNVGISLGKRQQFDAVLDSRLARYVQFRPRLFFFVQLQHMREDSQPRLEHDGLVASWPAISHKQRDALSASQQRSLLDPSGCDGN